MPRSATLPDTVDPAAFPRAFALFEAFNDNTTGRKPYEPTTRLAFALIATGEATTAREAARLVGMSEASLYVQRSRPQGKKLAADLDALFLRNAGKKAVRNIAKLADQDKNLNVSMRANEWLSAVNGLAPSQQVNVRHSGSVEFVGLTIELPPLLAPNAIAPDVQSIGKTIEDAEIIE